MSCGGKSILLVLMPHHFNMKGGDGMANLHECCNEYACGKAVWQENNPGQMVPYCADTKCAANDGFWLAREHRENTCPQCGGPTDRKGDLCSASCEIAYGECPVCGAPSKGNRRCFFCSQD